MLLWPPSPYSMLEEKSQFCLVQNPTLIRKGGGGGGVEGGYLKSDATFPTLLSRIVVLRKLGLLFVPIYGKHRTASAIS